MLYAPADAAPADQETILNRLLEQADDLPADGASGTTQLALPALDEAAAQLAAFVAAQGTSSSAT
jgi:hypothetical protein